MVLRAGFSCPEVLQIGDTVCRLRVNSVQVLALKLYATFILNAVKMLVTYWRNCVLSWRSMCENKFLCSLVLVCLKV